MNTNAKNLKCHKSFSVVRGKSLYELSQVRTYALPNHFQKQLNSLFLIDQKMTLAKIWKTRRFTVLRLMLPLKGTAPNLHTIQFILTEHALFSFYLLWYLFFLSLYSKAISQRPQVSCIFFDENKSDKN